MESQEEYAENNPVITQICETVYPFENLFSRAKDLQDDKNVAGIIRYLNSINEAFSMLPIETTETTVKEEAGKLMIGGGPTIEITAENFDQMKTLIRSIRTEITTI